MILSFWTDWSGQIVQTQIRLLLQEQSDQGLHYLQYCQSLCIFWMHYSVVKPLFSSFKMITAKFFSVRKFRNFTVYTSVMIVEFCSFYQICLHCDLYPLAAHFYIEKLGFTGIYIIFLDKSWVLIRTVSLRRF